MPRPRKPIRCVAKHVMLPEDVAALVELELFSNAVGRVPYSAWTNLLTELLNEWLEKRGVKRG